MVTKDSIMKMLSEKECHFVQKSELQKELQNLLNTRNRFEKGDDSDKIDYCVYFTSGDTYSTSNFCDIRIDYLETKEKGTIFVTGFEILNYQS